MKDRLNRVKNAYDKHRTKITTTAGVVAGAAVTYNLMKIDPTQVRHLVLTADQAKTLISEAGKTCAEFTTPLQVVHVAVDPNS